MIWLFDLDNTLHDASHAILPAITANMNAFIAAQLANEGRANDHAETDRVRVTYWARYGATAAGIVRHHAVALDDFLRAAHQFDDLDSLIKAERGLNIALQKLPGRKILLTNSSRAYSKAILKKLRLQPCFSDHLPFESMLVHRQFLPKPSRRFFMKLLARLKRPPSEVILVEDSHKILKIARQLGIRTVLVTGHTRPETGLRHASPFSRAGQRKRPPYIDMKVTSVRQLTRRLALFNKQ